MNPPAIVRNRKEHTAVSVVPCYRNIFLRALLMFSLCSCYKNKYKCYECKVLVLNPYEVRTFSRCTERIDTVRYKDANGNMLPVSCTEK